MKERLLLDGANDMFARRDNRFVVFNGTGLDTWGKDSKEPRTKTHGLEDDIQIVL